MTVIKTVKLIYIGTETREVPGIGLYEPGWEGEASKDKEEALLSSGLFVIDKKAEADPKPQNEKIKIKRESDK